MVFCSIIRGIALHVMLEDAYCPDNYVPQFKAVCDEYTRRGGALFIPEAATHSYCAPCLVYTVGHYHAMCYSPFGFDDIGHPFTKELISIPDLVTS